MKLRGLIETLDEIKPNQYSEQIKTVWLNEVENIVIDEILNKRDGLEVIDPVIYRYEDDADKELLVPDHYADLYYNYLAAKIDFSNAEYQRYNNSTLIYNASFDAFACYIRRNNLPKQSVSFNSF